MLAASRPRSRWSSDLQRAHPTPLATRGDRTSSECPAGVVHGRLRSLGLRKVGPLAQGVNPLCSHTPGGVRSQPLQRRYDNVGFEQLLPLRFGKPSRDHARRGRPAGSTKRLVSLRLDEAVIDRFRADGPGWQSRINEALRKAAGL